MLALASWVGNAGDNLWSTPENWAGGVIPVDGDDVTIDAGASNPNIRFTQDAGTARLNSLFTSEALTITGGALWVRTTATLRAAVTVSGGTLGGGSIEVGDTSKAVWDSTAGPIFFTPGTPSRIEGRVRIIGSVTVTSATVRVKGELELTGLATITSGALDFENTQTTLTSGFFVLNNGRLGMAAASGDAAGASKSLTIGTSVSVRGWGSVGGALLSQNVRTTLINDGTISADSPAHWLTIAPLGAFESTFTNNSVVRVTGGGLARVAAVNFTNYIDEDSGTLVGGTWRVDAQSTLSFDYNRAVTVNQAFISVSGPNGQFPNLMEQVRTNLGSITVGNGLIWSMYLGFSNRGTVTLESVSNLNLPVGGVHTGTFIVHAQSVLTLNSGAVMQPGAQLGGAGTIIYSSGTIAMGNHFIPGNTLKVLVQARAAVTLTQDVSIGAMENLGTLNIGIFRLSLAGNSGISYVQGMAGSMTLDIMGGGRMGSVVGLGSVLFNGRLNIISSTGFDPSEATEPNFTAVLFTGSSLSGSFGQVDVISVSFGSYLFVNTGSSFELWHNVADYNGDGGVDGTDLETFFVVWASGNSAGDINGDGGVDGADLEAFLGLWSAGGR
jgi:hypothetical protein